MNNKTLIFGTGPLGMWVAKLLTKKGEKVTVVNQKGKIKGFSHNPNITVKALNLYDSTQVATLCKDANHIFHCAMPPYTAWSENYHLLTQAIIKGLEDSNAKLIYGDNLYMYGENSFHNLTEECAMDTTTKKGKIRAIAAQEFLRSKTDTAIVRGSDFFGPFVKNALLGADFFLSAIHGKTVNLMGNIDLPHSYTYIKDFANTMITVSKNKECYNQVWHVPNAPTITTREFIKLVENEINQPIKIRITGNKMLSFLALFNPLISEIKEMMPQVTNPYIVSHQKYQNKFGDNFTPLQQAIKATIDGLIHDNGISL